MSAAQYRAVERIRALIAAAGPINDSPSDDALMKIIADYSFDVGDHSEAVAASGVMTREGHIRMAALDQAMRMEESQRAALTTEDIVKRADAFAAFLRGAA